MTFKEAMRRVYNWAKQEEGKPRLKCQDLEALIEMTGQIIDDSKGAILESGWEEEDVVNFLKAKTKFWEEFKQIFRNENGSWKREMFEYCFKDENLQTFQKIWTFNHMYGLFIRDLGEIEKKPIENKHIPWYLQNLSEIYLYLGFYENFSSYLAPFLQILYNKKIDPEDKSITRIGINYRVLFKIFCKFEKFNEVFRYWWRNIIAHYDLIIKKECYDISRRNQKEREVEEVESAKSNLRVLANVVVIVMTSFDEVIFKIVNENWRKKTERESEQIKSLLEKFRSYFKAYYESWESMGKIENSRAD
ncbi:MAG: hypothetical protein ACTSU5_02855 [Promethearchaeota archaeon]